MARIGCFLLALLVARVGAAQESPSRELARTEPIVLGVELAVAALALGGGYVVSRNAPDSCRWCASNGFDEGFRDAFRSSTPRKPGMVSDLLTIGIVPALAAGALAGPALKAGRRDHALENLVIAASAAGLSLGLALGVKGTTARKRPAEHHGVLTETEARNKDVERFVSFYSAHTTSTFALASSSATLSYLRGYDSAAYVAFAGGAVGLTTGFLRIAADMHWATDVLVGAASGTAVGVALPLIVHSREHRREGGTVTVSPLLGDVNGFALYGTF